MKAQTRSTRFPCNTTPDVAKKEQRKGKIVKSKNRECFDGTDGIC